jgi:glycine cleavage system H protein
VVNKDPYGKGWMVRIKITNPSEIDELLTPEKYKVLIGA